jgi:hypothetical protein
MNIIQISPLHPFHITCPRCNKDTVEVNGLFFQGIHTLTDCHCSSCHLIFFQTLSIGHAIYFPISFSKDGNHTWFNPRAKVWLAQPLIDSMTSNQPASAQFEVTSFTNHNEVIVVNCLDSCFGHAFGKMWNVELLLAKYPEKGIIVVAPANCFWLVPEGVAEVWQVKAPMKTLNKKVEGLDSFIKTQLLRFQKVWLSETQPYPDQHLISFEKFVKQKRFHLNDFEKRTQITFVLREDRFWHNSVLMDFLFKVFVKTKTLSSFSKFFVWRQNRLVNKTIGLILKQLPAATFCICGLGKTGTYSPGIEDYRATHINLEIEKKWNEVFASSNIVIGIHGSSMLIPTSLAAGFIDLVPRYKIQHLSEDTVLPYTNRYLSFLGRYLDEYSSPRLVATHLVSMINDFPYLYKNTEELTKE